VLRVVDITEISAVVAAAGVLVGVVYYILDMRNQTRQRQTDMLWRIYSSFNSKEFQEAMIKVQILEFKDHNDFVKKYGSFFKSPVALAFGMVGNMYEGLGHLLHRKLVDPELVFEFVPVGWAWEKMKPMIEELRKQFNMPG